jgi:hypothetical protein
MTPSMKIAWRSGYGNHIKAETAYEEIERIRAANGGEVTPLDIYSAAKSKDSPLHLEVFDRAVKDAAQAYYMDRAGSVLRALTIIPVGMEEPVRAYPVIRHEESPRVKSRNVAVFTSMEDALRDPAHRQTVLAQAISELAGFRKKYAALSELAILWPVVDQLAAAI